MTRTGSPVPQVYIDPITRKRKFRVVQQIVKRKLTGKPPVKKTEADALFKGAV